MFKYDKEKLKNTMDLYFGNDGWKSVYDEAPSDACRDYLKLTFYRSENNEPAGSELREIKERLYKKMGIDDWEYLYGVFPGPFRRVCKEKIEELRGK